MGMITNLLASVLALVPERGWTAIVQPRSFTIAHDHFVKDGSKFFIRSGSLHYFRVPTEYWRDRMMRMKALGLNTVTMYVPWNYHESTEGDVQGLGMVNRFLQTAHSLGLLVILRPGPYICAEWEMGGLPAWLLAKPGLRLRTYDSFYIAAVERWWARLFSVVSSFSYARGGPIVLVQLENEYASYGDCANNAQDAKYMNFLLSMGITYFGKEQLFSTIDGGEGPTPANLHRGSPWVGDERVLATVDGGLCSTRTCYASSFANQKAFNAPGHSPKMWTELWVGWFTVWRDAVAANKTSAEFYAGVAEMMAENASFSLYMAHGGTNFGLWSGANGDQTSEGSESFKPVITSYDYSSPISEAGDHNVGADGGDLYLAVRQAIGTNSTKEPPPVPKVAYGKIQLNESVLLFDSLGVLGTNEALFREIPMLPSMETLGCWYGLVLYEMHEVPFAELTMNFSSRTLHDRIQIFVDDKEVASAYRADCPLSLKLPAGEKLQLLVENMGRINYGATSMYDYKGLLAPPPVAGRVKATCLPLHVDQLQQLNFEHTRETSSSSATHSKSRPIFRRGSFRLSKAPMDTFLDTNGFTKGFIWVNGRSLGRFWEVGPQHTLYVPAPFLRQGENKIIVLDLHGSEKDALFSVAGPRYSHARR